jgi:hypothetical protein
MVRTMSVALISLAALSAEPVSADSDPLGSLAVAGFGEMVGIWSSPKGWETQLRRNDDGTSTCVTISPVYRAGQERYKVAFYYGDSNGISLINDRFVPEIKKIAINFADGGGLDLTAIETMKSDNANRYFNSISRSMFTKFVNSYRQSKITIFDVNGGFYLLVQTDADGLYSTMKKCEDFRLGRVLPD